MKLRLVSSLPIAVAIIATLAIALAGPTRAERLPGSDHGGMSISVTMAGANERPGPGDPDGTGTASFTFNYGQSEICYSLEVSGIAAATAAHIHVAPTTAPGPVVVPLMPPTSGSSSACTTVDQDLLKAIMQSPENYYVNVHNVDFPAGAIRSQLG